MNENWKGYTILLSSVERESTIEKFGVYIPSSSVKGYCMAKVAYDRFLNNKVRCTPGMIAGVVEKGIDFALIAPKTRMFKRELDIKWSEEVGIGIGISKTIELERKKYQVFVLA